MLDTSKVAVMKMIPALPKGCDLERHKDTPQLNLQLSSVYACGLSHACLPSHPEWSTKIPAHVHAL